LKRQILELQKHERKGKKSRREIDNQSAVLTVCWLLFFKTLKSLAYERNHLVLGLVEILAVCMCSVCESMEQLHRRMHVLCWTPSAGHLLQKSGKPIELHTLLTPSGQLGRVSDLRENIPAHHSFNATNARHKEVHNREDC